MSEGIQLYQVDVSRSKYDKVAVNIPGTVFPPTT